MENRGFTSENRGRAMCHATPSNCKEYDFQNTKGRTENKHLTIEKSANYKERHDVYNSAHAHNWVVNEDGAKDYILTCQAMAEEADRIRVTMGATGKEKAEYLTGEGVFNFYFCRLQWQNEKHGRLCTNPLSTKAGGRRRQLETLKANGVVNVPTFEEIERAYAK